MLEIIPNNYTVEKATKISENEVKALVQMILDNIRPYISSPLLRHAKTKSMSNLNNNFILIKDNVRTVAFLMYRIDKELTFIYEIHVEEKYRSNKLGTFLMNQAFEDQKGQKLILFVHKKNYRAQNFYKKFGFEFDLKDDYNLYFKMIKLNF